MRKMWKVEKYKEKEEKKNEINTHTEQKQLQDTRA